MFKKVTWRFWAAAGAALAAYGLTGYWLNGNGHVEGWIYRIGLTTGAAVPLAFVIIWTVFGLTSSRAAARWWKSSLSSALVIAALSLVPIAWPLAWVFWMDGGDLRQSWLAWIEVSGPCISTLAWLRVCWLWMRVRAADTVRSQSEASGQ